MDEDLIDITTFDLSQRTQAIRIFINHPDHHYNPYTTRSPVPTNVLTSPRPSLPSAAVDESRDSIEADEDSEIREACLDSSQQSTGLTETSNISVAPSTQIELIPLCSPEFRFNDRRNIKEMAIWWLDHPAAHEWQAMVNRGTHKYPGVDVPMRQSNTYKRLHNYKVLGEFYRTIGEEIFDILLTIGDTGKYYGCPEGMKIIRETQEHQSQITIAKQARHRAAIRQATLKKVDLYRRKLQQEQQTKVITRQKRKRNRNVEANIIALTEADVYRRTVADALDNL